MKHSTAIYTKIDATLVGLLGLSAMLVTRIIEWQDALEEKGAWDVFIWLGGIIGLADWLVKFGFVAWFAKLVAAHLVGIPWYVSLGLVVLIYFYSQYAFAGMTSHVVAMYAVLIAVTAVAGVPKYLIALTLAYTSSICAVLTPYGTAPAPIYFGAGYVEAKTWWKLNITLGGNIIAACHYDLIMTGASIVADGRPVLKDGRKIQERLDSLTNYGCQAQDCKTDGRTTT